MIQRFNPRLRAALVAALTLLLTTATSVMAQNIMRNFELTLKAAASRLQSFARTPGELANVAIVSASVERSRVCGFTSPLTHYSFLVKVGPGEHDFIRLHRVVREGQNRSIYRPRPAVFMLHGDIWGFEGAFLSSGQANNVPCDQSIAAYLANQEVDVWGMDLRWVLLPAGTPNPTFLREWGTDVDVQDIAVGMAVARAVRNAEGRGRDQLHLLGWSSGAFRVYAFANDETRFPAGLRHAKGLIPVDMVFKFSPQDEALRRNACQIAAANQTLFDQGSVYSTGDFWQNLGRLALADPNGASPLIPGFTNRELLLTVGAQTYLFFPIVPFYHFTGSTFDAAGKPTGFRYSSPEYMAEVTQQAANFQAAKPFVEYTQTFCNETDVPWDNNLREISVPVLYVGAEGGFGSYGLHTLTLLGSRDVSSHIVSHDARPLDFGHADLFWADNARAEVWAVIYDWLRTH